jgi:hypothetical protein
MPRLPMLLGVLSYAFASRCLKAQDSLSLDPSVAHVVTGGSWSSGTASGQYRIVVRTGGWEHVVSELYIQWLQEDPQVQRIVVRATQLVTSVTPGIYSLGRPDLTCTDTGCRVQISGTVSTSPSQQASWVLKLGAPGQYAVISM